MNPKVLIEAAKRVKDNPKVPSRLLHSQFKRSTWLKPEPIKNKPAKQRLTKVQKDLLKAFDLFMKVNACLTCDTPAGGWCRNCKKYTIGLSEKKMFIGSGRISKNLTEL